MSMCRQTCSAMPEQHRPILNTVRRRASTEEHALQRASTVTRLSKHVDSHTSTVNRQKIDEPMACNHAYSTVHDHNTQYHPAQRAQGLSANEQGSPLTVLNMARVERVAVSDVENEVRLEKRGREHEPQTHTRVS